MNIENVDKKYSVVINSEEQYSLWPIDKNVPGGWQGIGVCGSEDHCLAYIENNWTDIRPLSLRNKQV